MDGRRLPCRNVRGRKPQDFSAALAQTLSIVTLKIWKISHTLIFAYFHSPFYHTWMSNVCKTWSHIVQLSTVFQDRALTVSFQPAVQSCKDKCKKKKKYKQMFRELFHISSIYLGMIKTIWLTAPAIVPLCPQGLAPADHAKSFQQTPPISSQIFHLFCIFFFFFICLWLIGVLLTCIYSFDWESVRDVAVLEKSKQ